MKVAFEDSVLQEAGNGGRHAAGAYSQQLGQRLRQVRKLHGLTQRDLAVKLGVSTPALCRWEKGQALPRKSNLRAFADAFELSEDELLSGIDATVETISEPVSVTQSPTRRADDVPAISRDSLSNLLTACKRKIAEAAGTSPERVRIVIEV